MITRLGIALTLAALLVLVTAGRAGACERPRSFVSSTVSIDIDAPIEEVFRFVVAEDTPQKVLRPYGLVPSVVRSRTLNGPWERVGAARIVTLSDTTTLRESITAFLPPHFFAYRIDRLTSLFGRFVESGTGVWQLASIGRGRTRVVWTYAFEPRSCAARPFLRAGVSIFYRPFMSSALARAKRQVEAAIVHRHQ